MKLPYDNRPTCLIDSDIPDKGEAYTKQRGPDALFDPCELGMSYIAPAAESSALILPLHVVNSDE